MEKPYAGLGSKVGFIFGSTAICACFFTWFCIPECKSKTLEEIDKLFLDGVPVRKFGKIQVQVISDGARLAASGKEAEIAIIEQRGTV